jgi:cytochrome c553
MNQRSVLAIATTFTLAGAAFAATATERAQLDGAELFTYHGCVNCHGAQGKNPESQLVPKLAG